MILEIVIFTCLIFSIFYPLFFWIEHKRPIQNGFFRFNIGMVCILAAVSFWALQGKAWGQPLGLLWLTSLFLIGLYYWNTEKSNLWLVSLTSLVGFFFLTQSIYIGMFKDPLSFLVTLWGGNILTASLFAMILGHWYLNVHGLPLEYLKKSTQILLVLLLGRLSWDIFQACAGKILYRGDMLPVWKFFLKIDGFLFWIAFIFGVLLPLMTTYFVFGTLKLKNTQAATGLLYVIVASVLIGDLTYKYYLIKFGIAL